MTDDDLTKLEALLAKASPAPWRAVVEDAQPQTLYRALIGIAANPIDPGGYVSVVQDDERTVAQEEWAPNAELIAASRNALPDLIAEVRRLRVDRRALVSAASIYLSLSTGDPRRGGALGRLATVLDQVTTGGARPVASEAGD